MDLSDGDFVGGRIYNRRLWNVAVLAVTRALWLERNNQIFEEVEKDSSKMWESIKYCVALWISQSKKALLCFPFLFFKGWDT